MNKPFQFKQFSVNQDQCAMKIGTDAVLLGAWTSLEHKPFSILDIGSGTGVLALMLAQRSSAEVIDAIEIDTDGYEQCVSNFENSPWSDRLFCYHASLEEFVDEIEEKYNLIISNPPFYSPSLVSPFDSKKIKKADSPNLRFPPKGETLMSDARKTARFYDAMPFEHLIESVAKLLSEDGKFSVIIPFKEEDKFISIASEVHLFPNRILQVKGSPSSETKRSLIEFSFRESALKLEDLIIETSRHQYTPEYINLTKDFYLKM
jgi:tRNA1Val (adenine37-N6)-methyltransferase